MLRVREARPDGGDVEAERPAVPLEQRQVVAGAAAAVEQARSVRLPAARASHGATASKARNQKWVRSAR
jgi:hypothetical protein